MTWYRTEILGLQARAEEAERELQQKKTDSSEAKQSLGETGGLTPSKGEEGVVLREEGKEAKVEEQEEKKEEEGLGEGQGQVEEKQEEGGKKEEVEERDFAFGTVYRTLLSPVARVSPANGGCPHPAFVFAEHALIAQEKVRRKRVCWLSPLRVAFSSAAVSCFCCLGRCRERRMRPRERCRREILHAMEKNLSRR